MKKILKRVLLLFLCGLIVSSLASCGGRKELENVFKLPHFDGSSEQKGYDTDLLYKNQSDFYGGDSGVIWVSKEQDPTYGGYFYQYMSDCGGVANPGSSEIDENGRQYWGHFMLSRSKDLNDWEICGTVGNGWCLKITNPDAWCNVIKNDSSMFFAPEVIYNPCTCKTNECSVKAHSKYFMYYSAKSKRNDGSIAGALYSDDSAWTSRQYIGVAMSDNPVGPFEMVTAESYYGDENAVDLNGNPVDEINPQIMFERFGFGSNPGDTGFANYDAHPWFDSDGTLYLYFVKANNYNSIWGMKMKDMITPDFDSVSNLIENFNAVRTVYIIISSGGEGSIVLKQTGYSWERNRLCLQLGTGVNDELSIGGFNHSLGSKGGTIKITVVRYNEAIYVFDKEGDIGFYLDAEGVHLVGDHQLKSNQLSRLPAINNKIKAFFARGGENAVGMINFDYVRAEWTKVKMDKGSIAAAEALRLYAIDFECETQDYSAHIEGIKSGEKYIGIAPVKIVFEMKNDRCPIEINVNSNGASTMVRGKVKGFVTEFEIKVVDDCAVTVSDYAQKNIYSGNIVGATTQAVLELYDEDGEFVGKDEEIFDEQGNYSLTLLGDKYSVIVMEADKAAFIDDLSSCADAALKFIPIITGEAYAERKDCEDGEWSSNDSRVKEYKLTNMASNADYEYNFSIVSGVAGDLYGEAALQLSVNIDKVVYMLYIGRMRSSGDNPLVLRFYKNGIEQSRCYNFVYSYNGKKGDSSFGSHFSDGLNQTYKISRVGREIIISMGKMDAGVASYRPMFRITANGMDFADDGLTIVSKHNLNNADLKEICKALCSENATHEFSLYTVTLTSWLLSAKKVETEKWECNVVSAANGSAMVDLYNEDGNLLTSCVAFVSDEKIAMLLDKKILSSAKKAIISQSNKIGFIDDLAADESVTMVDALTVTGDTYAERKDSSDGSWTYNDSKARIFNFKNMSSATDYEYTFSIVSAAAGDAVGEAALEISVGEYMLYIGRTRYAGNNPLVLRFYKNGEEQSRCYNFIYSYNGKTGDSSFGSHFSGGLNQTYKVSRAGREIIISMGNVDNGVASYHPMFRITENGMEFADEGLSIVSSHNLDNADLKNICKALCAEKATHNFALYKRI